MTARATDRTRPRIEGAREQQVLDAAVELLLAHGYDRLTMEAVAHRASAGKATLYRRWATKQALVVDALIRSERAVTADPPDTGTLRDDLVGAWRDKHGTADATTTRVLAAVMSPLQTDPAFAAEFRDRFLAPRMAATAAIYRRAAERGELVPGADPELLGPALAGILLHRSYVLGVPITPQLVARVVDEILLPAATGRHRGPTPSQESR